MKSIRVQSEDEASAGGTEQANAVQAEKIETAQKTGAKAFNIRWGLIGSACAILVFYLTVGFVASWLILDKIAAQTSHTASPFGTWWQVLVFVLDIVFVLGAAASYAMMIVCSIKRRKAHAAQ